MDEVLSAGAFGTIGSLYLRTGQAVFGFASLLSMCLSAEFFSYTSLRFFVTIMGLVILWSLTLAVFEIVIISGQNAAGPPDLLSFVVLGDFVLALMSFAAACVTKSTTSNMLAAENSSFMENMCLRYEVAAATAFITWFLLMASVTFNSWILPWVQFSGVTPSRSMM